MHNTYFDANLLCQFYICVTLTVFKIKKNKKEKKQKAEHSFNDRITMQSVYFVYNYLANKQLDPR